MAHPLLPTSPVQVSVQDCSGSYAFHFSHAVMEAKALTPGTSVYAQYLSRDTGFAAPNAVGLTEAVELTVLH